MRKMSKIAPPGVVKPGWTTTEFWQTLLVQAVAAVVTLGTVFHTHFRLNGLQAVVPAVATFAAAIAQSVYSHSRATVKAAAQTAGVHAQVASSGSSQIAAAVEAAPIVVQLTGIGAAAGKAGDGPHSGAD